MFTLKILVAGVVRLVEPGMTFARWRTLAPSLEPMIQDLVPAGKVVFLAESDDSNVVNILGVWR